jgi:Flp pilus assembly protein TadG
MNKFATKMMNVPARLRLDEASQIVESALVLPLFFMVLIAVFWFGQAFRIYGTLTNAAREGARAAAAPACTTCTAVSNPSANAFNAVSSVLVAAKLDPTKLQKPTTTPSVCGPCPGAPCTGAIACDTSETNICVQGISHSGGNLDQDHIQISSTTNGTGVCGVSVSFQYPYQFWLPFTTLNMQAINLRAQAQARVEEQ